MDHCRGGNGGTRASSVLQPFRSDVTSLFVAPQTRSIRRGTHTSSVVVMVRPRDGLRPPGRAFGRLEPDEWKLSSPVLRGGGGREAAPFPACVLELFHTGLRHRDIFATVSDRWSDPRARLLAGSRWDDAKGAALSALQLPEDPDALLAAHAADLDAAWRAAAGGIIPDGDVSVDAEGRLHVGKDNALDEPASLIDLPRTAGMLPGVDLPEMILEVMAEYPAFAAAFTAVSGGTTRLKDMHISIAALLTAHSLNIGLGPVLADADALTRDRLAHVDQHYLRPENYAAANAVLIKAQAAIGLAQTWGGGMVAAVDGMRFVSRSAPPTVTRHRIDSSRVTE